MTRFEDERFKGERFEGELRSALRRQEAPEGFADRVLARAAEQASRQPKPTWWGWWREGFVQPFASGMLMRWAAVGAVCLALIAWGVVGGVHYRNIQREHARGEAAKERLLLALHIAGSKLQLAKIRVGQINSDQRNTDQTIDQGGNQQERE